MRRSWYALVVPLAVGMLAAACETEPAADCDPVEDPVEDPIEDPGQGDPIDLTRWSHAGELFEVTEHLGRESIHMKNAIAWLTDESFTDGIIEFDIANTGERGFMGAVWRLQDPANYEEFYIRPHQSGNPDANQYSPVYNGLAAWQLYHGPGYGTPVVYSADKWIHIKIVVADEQAEVFVDSDEPVLFIPELKRSTDAGAVGLQTFIAEAWVSNFRVVAMETPPDLLGTPPEAAPNPPGAIQQWSVSSRFGEGFLGTEVLDEDLQDLSWSVLDAEDSGLINLARSQGITQTENTAFARVFIDSDQAQTKKMQIGYSDRVKVYVNGQIVFSGQHNYASRDYRYLGTIGLFEEIYLNLGPGENEVLLAVSETFGGWGVMANMEDQEGLLIYP